MRLGGANPPLHIHGYRSKESHCGEPIMTLMDDNLDELDRKIILTLQTDARRPFKSIAKDNNVSEGTISNRVNRLLNNNILKLEARINPFAINKIGALLGVNLKERSHETTIKQIQAMENVTSVWVTTGKYDLFVEVLVNSINELNHFIFAGGLSKIDNISFTETHIMLYSETKFLKIC